MMQCLKVVKVSKLCNVATAASFLSAETAMEITRLCVSTEYKIMIMLNTYEQDHRTRMRRYSHKCISCEIEDAHVDNVILKLSLKSHQCIGTANTMCNS